MVDHGASGLQNSAKAVNFTRGDRKSSGLQRNSEVENAQKTWGDRHRKCFAQKNGRHMSRQSSADSYRSEENHDNMILR